MNRKLRIAVVGGSACSSAGLDSNSKSWPLLLEQAYQGELQYISLGGLTIVRTIDLINEIKPCDLLILNLGTSTGWPIPITKLQDKFGIKFSSEFGFHQPIKRDKKPFLFKLRKLLKLRLKNFIKYVLFCFGLQYFRKNINLVIYFIDTSFWPIKSKAKEKVFYKIFQSQF